MKGVILSPELISGDDDRRYAFSRSDVVNLAGNDLAGLTGSQVDFVSLDGVSAKSIYIIAKNINFGALSADVGPARTKALWGLGLQFFNFIPYIGQIIAIVGFVLYSMGVYSLSRAAESKSLFKNYIIAVLIGFLGGFLIFMAAIIFGVSMGVLTSDEHVGIGAGLLAMILLGAIVTLIVAIYGYKIHAELAALSGSLLFLWAFWLYLASVFLCLSIFGALAGLAGFVIAWVLLFIAWWKFESISKSE